MTKKILVVEDDPDILNAVTEAMDAEGFDVVAALDISVAEALIKVGMPDVAIIDHHLPDGTGDQLCEKIQTASGIPVIMFTGEDQKSTVLDCVRAGVVDYVLKGTGLDELVARVLKHAA